MFVNRCLLCEKDLHTEGHYYYYSIIITITITITITVIHY